VRVLQKPRIMHFYFSSIYKPRWGKLICYNRKGQRIFLVLCLLLFFQSAFAQPNITRVEYYVNTDPGYGNGTAVSIVPGPNLAGLSFTVDLTPLAAGVHIAGVRSRDANGAWSIDNKWLFVKPYSSIGSPTPNVTRVEWYVDTDPGRGNGTAVAISPGQDIAGLSFSIDIPPLLEGVHIVGVRSRDANGAWSIDNRWLFVKPYSINASTVPNITRVEWYLDTDPGQGNATPLTISPGQTTLSDLSFMQSLTNLLSGVHILGIRTRDANGAWSIDNRWLFVKPYTGNAINPRTITQAEYYLDTDPGYGKGTPVALYPKNNIPGKDIFANVTGLTSGKHYIYLRSRDSSAAWSFDYIDSFTVASPIASPVLLINSVAKTSICDRDSVTVGFDASGSYGGGNTFKVFLSDAAGSFAAETEIGSITGTTDGLIKCQIPQHIPQGAGYKLRLKSSNPVLVSAASDFTWNLYDRPNFANDTSVFVVCATDLFNLNNLYNPAGYTLTWNTISPSVSDTGLYKLYAVNGNGCTDTVNVTVAQDVSTWVGGSSNNWHTPANWSTGRVPGASTHVIVPAGTANNCVLSASNAAAASVQVKPGAIMQVINSRVIVISGKCATLPPG
jgi:hypothetical protein